MKRIHGILVVALTISIFAGSASADDIFDGIGKGRLLRKLRDDLFGAPEKPDPKPTPAKKNARQPTPAQNRTAQGAASRHASSAPARGASPSHRHPQQSSQQSQHRHPSAQSRQSARYAPSRTPNPANRQSGQSRQPNQSNQSNNRHSSQARPGSDAPSPQRTAAGGPTAKGFGMHVVIGKDKNLYISQVDPRGNAAKASVQRGDRIVEVGGSKITDLNELTEIAKLLGGGDQLEFLISRRGKTKKALVQFGEQAELPEPSEVPSKVKTQNNEEAPGYPIVDEEMTLELGDVTPHPTKMPRLQAGDVVTRQYDFVPRSSPDGYQSVLEMNAAGRQAAVAAAAPKRPSGDRRLPVETKLSDRSMRFVSHQQESRGTLELTAPQMDNLNDEAIRSPFGTSILEVPPVSHGASMGK